MGFDKLFANLAGKPVLLYSIQAFCDCDDIDEVIVITKEDRVAEVEQLIASEHLAKVRKVLVGGTERHLSEVLGKVLGG